MAKLTTPADALPLLAYKIAPRQFDVSYRFSNISLRDQIVRAQSLIRTLLDAGLVQSNAPEVGDDFQLLICGAGAAGLAAAQEADALGISFVLIEKNIGAPNGVLKSNAKRFVSTAMYEWPHPNHSSHEFPLAFPELLGAEKYPMSSLPLALTKPVPIRAFGAAIEAVVKANVSVWRGNFNNFLLGHSVGKRSLFADETVLERGTKDELASMLDEKVSIHGVTLNAIELPLVKLARKPICSRAFRFQYVIYAVGFAEESEEYAEGKKPFKGYRHKSFWKPDQVRNPRLGFDENPTVGIIGSGDGALQEAIRCLAKSRVPHPLAFWDRVMKYPQGPLQRLIHSPYVRLAMAEVAAADGYTTSGAIWTHETHIFKSLDQALVDIIGRLLAYESGKFVAAINGTIRSDVKSVTIINREGFFSRAYALNRFLVLLLNEVKNLPGSKLQSRIEILSGEVVGFRKRGRNLRGADLTVQSIGGGRLERPCDLVIIRSGLDQKKSPTQLAGLSGIDTGRAELGRIPPAIRTIRTL